jgi:hypothetical protein
MRLSRHCHKWRGASSPSRCQIERFRAGITGQGHGYAGYTGYTLSRDPLWESGQSPRKGSEKLGQRDKAIADYRQSLLLDASMKRALEGLKRLDVN